MSFTRLAVQYVCSSHLCFARMNGAAAHAKVLF